MIVVDWGTQQRLGGADVVKARVVGFRDAMERHQSTVDVPAPTEDPFVERLARSGEDAVYEDEPPAAPPPERRLVDKGVITERIIAAGKLREALAALATLSLEDQQRWANKAAVYADDERARGLLAHIGLDPDVILAP